MITHSLGGAGLALGNWCSREKRQRVGGKNINEINRQAAAILRVKRITRLARNTFRPQIVLDIHWAEPFASAALNL